MTQFARPASDITTTNWNPPLFSKLNDQSDATAARPNNGVTTACEVKLDSVTDPAVSTGHIVKVHAKATGSSAGEQQTVDLYQGGSAIATGIITGTVSRTAQTEYTGTLSGAQADAITDYSDLRIRLRMSTGGGTEFIEFAEAWLEIPDAFSDATVTPSTIAAVAGIPAPGFPAAVDPATIQSTATIGDSWSLPATASTLAGAGDGTATPSTVAAVAGVPALSVLGAAQPTPGTVAALGAVPAPTVQANAQATPSTVAGIAAVPTPTILVAGDATVQPSSVAVVASVPTPTILAGGNVTVLPSTIAATASVPAPATQATGRVTPSVVAALSSIPAPTLRSDQRVSPGSLSIVITIPASTTKGSSILVPATIAALVALPTPPFIGGGTMGTPVDDPRAVDLVSAGQASVFGLEEGRAVDVSQGW